MAKDRRKRKIKAITKRVAARAYEAAMSVPSRKHVINAGMSHDAALESAGHRIQAWGRYLDENHDVVVNILSEVVKGAIGPRGIITVPKPMRPDGSIDDETGRALMKRWRRWGRRCDVTGQLSWCQAQQLLGRMLWRDGDCFIQHVTDDRFPFNDLETPYRIEILEADMVPRDLMQEDQGWRQGIRLNAWRQPVAYAVYRQHPGDLGSTPAVSFNDVIEVPAANITHLKHTKRWPATRGVSLLHAVISRLWDVKDLEESERIKSRVLASWTAAIQRAPDIPGYEPADDQGQRFLQMAGGTIIDTLAPGETITGVGPEYPQTGMNDYIADQMRRIAGGTGTRYSSIARRYDGSYSSQRQELVESEADNQQREEYFAQRAVRAVYERWLVAEVVSGRTRLPAGMDIEDAMNADYRGPITGWVDPLKEIQADALAVERGFLSLEQVQTKRGASPELVNSEPPRRDPQQLRLISDEEDDDAEEA